ncbi:hypothetical protein GCM10022267_73600 [Lentzea roselyniae]|uniref:Alpha/beta hydrolase family protein n=1 Tax=Lentzea roselyniae TaxID=531940 RepID=A0ABP7C4G1_9PSEU
MPGDLRDKSVSFRTEDDVQLSGLVLGSGPRGVILASYLKQSYCDWLPLAQSLADSGNQVLLFDIRFFELGDPRMLKDEYKYDLDLQAAAQELTRRGATSIVAGGEARTAAAAVLAAPRIQGPAGLVLVSPVQGFGGVERSTFRQVKPVLESLTVPVFIASSDAPMSNGDPSFADSARVLADVSAASGSRLDLVSGASHGGRAGEDRRRVAGSRGRVRRRGAVEALVRAVHVADDRRSAGARPARGAVGVSAPAEGQRGGRRER